jgi:hypothetical protein
MKYLKDPFYYDVGCSSARRIDKVVKDSVLDEMTVGVRQPVTETVSTNFRMSIWMRLHNVFLGRI